MTQQQLLQSARDVMVCDAKFHRETLQKHAMKSGRTELSTKKASTMRLALWNSKGKSAI